MTKSTAITFGQIAVPKLKNLPKIEEFAKTLDERVEICSEFEPQYTALDILSPIFGDAFNYELAATLWVGPHTDSVVGDITAGVVISGDHYLFTGSGRQVGNLVPGTVFALQNKKLHGALIRDMKNPKPLVFAACEPKVPVEEWCRFCAESLKKINEQKVKVRKTELN